VRDCCIICLIREEITSHESDTWPAGTWVPLPHTDNEFNEDVVGPTSEVVEQLAQFEYAKGYGQMDYEQLMFHFLLIEEITSLEYDTWVPIPTTGL
jgi:hypothetical protein